MQTSISASRLHARNLQRLFDDDTTTDENDRRSMLSVSSEVSILEALSRSERIENGSIVIDWENLPRNMITSIPGAPGRRIRRRRLQESFAKEQLQEEMRAAESQPFGDSLLSSGMRDPQRVVVSGTFAGGTGTGRTQTTEISPSMVVPRAGRNDTCTDIDAISLPSDILRRSMPTFSASNGSGAGQRASRMTPAGLSSLNEESAFRPIVGGDVEHGGPIPALVEMRDAVTGHEHTMETAGEEIVAVLNRLVFFESVNGPTVGVPATYSQHEGGLGQDRNIATAISDLDDFEQVRQGLNANYQNDLAAQPADQDKDGMDNFTKYPPQMPYNADPTSSNEIQRGTWPPGSIGSDRDLLAALSDALPRDPRAYARASAKFSELSLNDLSLTGGSARQTPLPAATSPPRLGFSARASGPGGLTGASPRRKMTQSAMRSSPGRRSRLTVEKDVMDGTSVSGELEREEDGEYEYGEEGQGEDVREEKHEKFKAKEQELQLLEKQLADRSILLDEEVDRKVTDRFSAKEAEIKAEVESIIARYDQSLAALVKENRRLQNSLKDVVAVNRQVRDQCKQVSNELHDKSGRCEELTHQLKLYKERIERLKTAPKRMIHIEHTTFRRQDTSVSRFDQLRKVVLDRPKPQRNSACQTASIVELLDMEPTAEEALKSYLEHPFTVSTHQMLYYMLSIHRRWLDDFTQDKSEYILRNAPMLVKAIISLYPIVITSPVRPSPSSSSSPHGTIIDDAYEEIDAESRPGLADLFLFFALDLARGERALGVLEGMVAELRGCLAKYTFIDAGGVDFVHPFLNVGKFEESVVATASAVLLNMCGDGDWLEDFLVQCGENEALVDSVSEGLLSARMETVENLAVVVQKMSRVE
ncbi:hypothetical protein HK101_006961 [Irineochytrium annulatum]|nr:hypothetical protein HK101_006961 [Irineochytrium annulatum]